MNSQLKILYFLIDLVLPLAVGYALKLWTRVPAKVFDRMMIFGLLVLVTALGALSFWNLELNVKMIWLPVIGVVMQVVPGGIALIRARSRYSGSLDRGSYVISQMLSNRGTAATITAFILLGEAGFALARLIIAFAGPVVYLVCYPMANAYRRRAVETDAGSRRRGLPVDWRQIPLLGIVAGVLLHYYGSARPETFSDLFPWLVHATAWCFLIPVGYALDFGEMRKIRHDWAGLFAIKFIATPLACGAMGVLVGLEGPHLAAIIILACAPTAINAVIISKLTRLNTHVAMGAFVLTHLAYLLVVVPITFIVFSLID